MCREISKATGSEIHKKVAEWNIWVDPLAAREVFAAGLPLYVVPLDATNQIMWTKANGLVWEASGTSINSMAGDVLD